MKLSESLSGSGVTDNFSESDDGKRMEVYFLRAGRCVTILYLRGGVQGRGVVRDSEVSTEVLHSSGAQIC